MSFKDSISYHFLESVDSTNTWVRLNYSQFDLSSLHVVYAEEQLKGRGTHGKFWYSPKGLNIYASLFFSLPENHLYSTLAQVLSVSIADTLKELGFKIAIKWPNDLFLHDKKIGGILCEIIPISNSLLIILGFGVNVNTPQSLCDAINQPASSLHAFSKESYSIFDLLKTMTEKFQQDLLVYLKQGFQAFLKRYHNYMTYIGYPVVFNDTILGTSHSINHQGELEVLTSEGKVVALTYGSIKI